MRKWNKLLALVLAMVMVFGLTATAFASSEGAAPEDEEQTEDTQPVGGEEDKDAAGPADGEDAAGPADGEDAAEPADGEDAAEPADGEDAAEPADGEDDAEPADGEGDAEPADEPAVPTFTDVTEGRWFYEFVMKMAEAKIVNGYTDGTFRPNGKVNWGQALKMALLAAKYEDAQPVEGGSWASGYIALAKSEGILAADAEIDHNANITRVEMCELLAKALKVAASEKESIFSDTDNGYVMALVDLGIISAADTFKPDDELSRAELCKILASIPEDAAAEPAEPAEGEDKDDAAEPAEGEDQKDDAEPADGEDQKDDAEPAEGEDQKDDAEPADGEDQNDEADAENKDAADAGDDAADKAGDAE